MVTLLLASIVAKPKGEGSEGTQGGSNDSRSMDCCICSPMASIYRPPRNAICSSCYEGAKAIIGFFNYNDERAEDDGDGLVKPRGLIKPNSSTKGVMDAWEQVKETRGREEETRERAVFLEQGFALAWKEGIHTDIVVKRAGGRPIPAHKAVLAARSDVFRHILSDDEDDDQCKAPPATPSPSRSLTTTISTTSSPSSTPAP